MGIRLPDLDLPDPTLRDFRKALEGEGLVIVDDDADLGFLSFHWDQGLLAYAGTRPHEAYFPLQYFDDTEFENRSPFDEAYHAFLKELTSHFGLPRGASTFTFSHRKKGQYYYYCWRQFTNCRLVLAQDERDIQFGLDLSARFIYDDGPLEPLIYGANG